MLRVNAERGADNLVIRCLRVAPKERVRIATWRCDDEYAIVAAACERAGAVVTRIALEALERMPDAERTTLLTTDFASAEASVMLASVGLDTTLSASVLRAAQSAGIRHVHVASIDLRVMSQSMRADPDTIAVLGERVRAIVRPPSALHVFGENGTQLDVGLSNRFPVALAAGRPEPGRADYLPSGTVFAFPASIQGRYVADRGVVGTGVRFAPASVRRAPVSVEIVDGRVRSFRTADPELSQAIDRYLASHVHAPRVGMVILPVNYIARAEIGLDIQDRLLPGCVISLGFTAQKSTQATFDAPVQLQLFARRLSVECAGRSLVTAGRLDESLVEGIDPFR